MLGQWIAALAAPLGRGEPLRQLQPPCVVRQLLR